MNRFTDHIALIAGLGLAWWGLAAVAGPEAVSGPVPTLARAAALITSPQFWVHAGATGRAFAYGLLFAVAIGLLLGFGLGANRFARSVGEPMLGTLYSVPKITLYPVILLFCGLGLSAKIVFGALHGVFPIALFTIGALKNINESLIKTARVLRLGRWQAATTVLLPAALPEIVSGLRIGCSATLLGTLISELFASDQGLGFILLRAMEANKVTDIMALTLLLFGFAAVMNGLLIAAEHAFRRDHA
jgi:NitT/TauT family transport system permease protein